MKRRVEKMVLIRKILEDKDNHVNKFTESRILTVHKTKIWMKKLKINNHAAIIIVPTQRTDLVVSIDAEIKVNSMRMMVKMEVTGKRNL
jgi:hypothetical protein